MATQVQFRRGTTTQNNAFTGAIGELTVDTDIKTLRLHDGSTPGGGAILINANAAQTLTNKVMSTNSQWQGQPVGLLFGGTGNALSAVAGSIAYGTSTGIALNSAGTSGQVLTSAGTGAPAWVSPSAITVGTSTNATNATNVLGGSAGNLVYQVDTSTSGFITPGAAGTFLQSTGSSTAPTWAAGQVTVGSTAIALGATATSIGGLDILTATGTSNWKLPAGTTAQRPGTPATGMIRYNSTLSTFEGYAASSWGSLGGVKSVDGFTYIIPETSAGAGNGDLDFYAENAGATAAQQVGQWNRTNLKDYTGTIVGTQTTQNVFNATATTVNAFGAATAISLGAATGTLTINNATVAHTGSGTFGGTLSVTGNTALNGGTLSTTATSLAVFNTTATTVNAFGAATTLNIGGASGTTTVGNNLVITGNLTVQGDQIINNTSTMEVEDSMIYIATGNAANSNDIGFVGHFTAGTYQHTGLVRDATDGTWKLFSNVSTEPSASTLDFTAAVYDPIRIGALTATTGSFSSTLGVTGAATLSSTLAVTGATTLSSTLDVTGNTTVTGDVAVNGGDITTTATTFNHINTTATTVNAFGAATALTLGATTGTATIRNATVAITNNATVGGTLAVTGNQTNTGDIAVNGGDITTTATTATVFNTTATTVNAFGAATTLSIGAGTGTITLNNANTIISGNLTVNGTTTTVNSSTVNLDNTILQLGGDTIPSVDDNQDRGVAFRWHNGTTAKNGFFGYDDSTGYFTFIPDATLTTGVASGTVGVIDAARITGSAATLTTARAINGTNFDGSAAITTANWGTARTITLNATGKSVNGSGDVAWTLAEIIPTSTNLQINSLGIGTAASGTAGEIRATGAITGYYSDERLKENIVEIDNAIEKVMSLRGVTFNANQIAESFGYSREDQVGVIAQDVEKVLPQIVKPAPFDLIRIDEHTEISRSGENYKTVQYEKIVPLLIQAIKEQQMMIEELQKKVGN